jgi:hypothetical protein
MEIDRVTGGARWVKKGKRGEMGWAGIRCGTACAVGRHALWDGMRCGTTHAEGRPTLWDRPKGSPVEDDETMDGAE